VERAAYDTDTLAKFESYPVAFEEGEVVIYDVRSVSGGG
jgi:hypothetical protein